MTPSSGKKDLVILDRCTVTKNLSELRAFSNATVLRITDIGLPSEAKDHQILEKITKLARTGEYRAVALITQDKGRDGDTTFSTAKARCGNNIHKK